jgi:Ca-activated chloride channel family protein
MVALLRRPLIALSIAATAAGAAFAPGASTFAVPAPAAMQTFSSRIDAVRVDVLVTENGRPLQGLTPDDFEVLDNGVRQRVDLASFEQIPLNVVLALDMSASLQGLRLGHLQTAGKRVLDGLKSGDRAALVTFSHVVAPSQGLTENLDRVRTALDQARGEGLTSLVDATHAGMLLGESDAGRSLLIVFSDGVDTSSWLTADAVLETARRGDVVVYSVEVGERRASFPRDLSEVTGGRLFAIESTTDLSATFSKILEEFRMRYLVSYSPQGVAAGGWHRLEVRVKNRNVTVKARPGYFAGQG